MARPGFPRTIMEFQDRFATEASCLAYLAASRWPEGFICPGCGGSEAWVLPDGVTFVHVIAHDKDPGGTGAYRT